MIHRKKMKVKIKKAMKKSKIQKAFNMIAYNKMNRVFKNFTKN